MRHPKIKALFLLGCLASFCLISCDQNTSVWLNNKAKDTIFVTLKPDGSWHSLDPGVVHRANGIYSLAPGTRMMLGNGINSTKCHDLIFDTINVFDKSNNILFNTKSRNDFIKQVNKDDNKKVNFEVVGNLRECEID